MGSYWDVWSRHIFSCVSSYYKGKYILCVIYRRVVAANISQFQQKCLQSENSVNISSSEVLTNSVSNLMICEYRIDMIHLKTIIMKKKLTWSPLYLTLLTKIVFWTKLCLYQTYTLYLDQNFVFYKLVSTPNWCLYQNCFLTKTNWVLMEIFLTTHHNQVSWWPI